MSSQTSIEWTEQTWNPAVGCSNGGRGKSGGVRIIYYYHNQRVPIFLLAVSNVS